MLKKHVFSTGVDIGSSHLKMAQLGVDSKGVYLHAACLRDCPADIVPGSGDWQRWAAKTIKVMFNAGGFKGRDVVTAMPPGDVFIDQIKIPKSAGDNIDEAVLANIESKLPFDSEGALVKHVIADRRQAGRRHCVRPTWA